MGTAKLKADYRERVQAPSRAGSLRPLTPTLAPAERMARLKACLIDGALCIAAGLPGGIVFTSGASDFRVVMGGWVLVLLGVLAMSMYQWNQIVRRGQTIGKMLVGIQIVQMDGAPVDFKSGVLLRVWAPFALSLLPYVGGAVQVVDALMIYGEERRCLHDRLAGTRVVRVLPDYYRR
jgi:uncharacterized RDD family membrane protein YckC